MFKNIKVENNLPVAEDVAARDEPRQLVDRLLRPVAGAPQVAHGEPDKTSTCVTMRRHRRAEVSGDYYGLPWPCWGSPEVKHPGTPLLYNTNLHRHGRRRHASAPRFGVEREERFPTAASARSACSADGSYSKGSEIKDGYPEFTLGVLKKLGWDKDLTEAELRHRSSTGQS